MKTNTSSAPPIFRLFWSRDGHVTISFRHFVFPLAEECTRYINIQLKAIWLIIISFSKKIITEPLVSVVYLYWSLTLFILILIFSDTIKEVSLLLSNLYDQCYGDSVADWAIGTTRPFPPNRRSWWCGVAHCPMCSDWQTGVPIKTAARQFGLPESSLRHKLSGRVDPEATRSGPQPILSMEEENYFVQHIKFMSECGYRYSRTEVVDMATSYTTSLWHSSGSMIACIDGLNSECWKHVDLRCSVPRRQLYSVCSYITVSLRQSSQSLI